MYNLSMRNMWSHFHALDLHHMSEGMVRLVHNERFWAVVILTAFVALLIGLALLMGPAESDFEAIPRRPFAPYWY